MFTIIAYYEESGQIYMQSFDAPDPMVAFKMAAGYDNELTMIAALPGDHYEGETVFFPGPGIVDAETILNQPDIYED